MNHNTTEKDSLSLASIFAEMTDRRKLKDIRYQFQTLLILRSLSKLCFQDTPSEITDWVLNRSDILKEKLGLKWKRMPSLSTWQRLLGQNIDAAVFDKKVGEYFQSISSPERQLYNLDGKVVCRTVDNQTNKQLHLLALQESAANLVIEQTALEAVKMKSAEPKDYSEKLIWKRRSSAEMRFLPNRKYLAQ